MKTFLQAVFGAVALLLSTEPAEARKIVSQLLAEVCTSDLNCWAADRSTCDTDGEHQIAFI